MFKLTVTCLCTLLIDITMFVTITADRPCAARQVPEESVLCVCNDTYCDEITRKAPQKGYFITYTSSKAGSRFRRTDGRLKPFSFSDSPLTLELDPFTLHQTIEGFGGAITDAASINWKSLSTPLQNYLINSYFSDKGLEYNMLRVPIGGTDFSTHPYGYDEESIDDKYLANFSLAYEDFHYKMPMIKSAMAVSTASLHIVSTTWSPPVWMKTNNQHTGKGSLKPIYYQTYADYHYKFIEEYHKEGIPIWGITTTNEPSNGLIPISTLVNSLGWTPDKLGYWIVEHLGPTIRNSTYHDVKILANDDQRYMIPFYFNMVVSENPKLLDWIDGVAVHFYGDLITSPKLLNYVTKEHPNLFVLATEACEGTVPWAPDVILGSWERGANYAYDIITDLNYDVIGWIDWNLCLNKNGGPTWTGNHVDSPIIVFPENGEFVKQPMFYVMGHFSKFVPRGSRRIQANEGSGFPGGNEIKHVAFVTPKNETLVLILYNKGGDKNITVKVDNKTAALTLESDSITTLELAL